MTRREALLAALGMVVLAPLPTRRIWQVGIALPRGCGGSGGTLIMRPADAQFPGVVPGENYVISAWIRPIGGEWRRVERTLTADEFRVGGELFGADVDLTGAPPARIWGLQLERSIG